MDLDETIAASAPPEVRAALGELYERLDDFPAEERVVLLLRRLEGFTLEELSGALGARGGRLLRRTAAAPCDQEGSEEEDAREDEDGKEARVHRREST